ncbi:M66 family metalloprotease [Providencia manganoxydans]|uniref:M66 family metalloprotease n=1 Tax=Providencia manganoxydans TaxID=2923283 RepID=UPI0029C037A2|nr:M66 family metalloprotease [Providencia manganoxydans]MDX4946807.1 M66 family metalloprotease [Providencia manganoxydans]
MDNPNEEQFLYQQASKGHLTFGYYHSQGRIAIIDKSSPLFDALQNSPDHTIDGNAIFLIMNWLNGQQYQAESNKLLSAVSPELLAGNTLHPKQNLYIDSFDSPYLWNKGETRAAEQLADALLPNGQWHRSYSTLVLSSNANDQQIQLARHMMSVTGKGLLIIKEKNTSPAVRKLINDITPPQYQRKSSRHSTTALEQPTKSGIAVYAYRHKHPPEELQSALLATLPHLQGSQHHLPSQPTETVWVYDMKVAIPQTGKFTFALDISNIQDNVQFKVGNYKVTVKQGDPTATISLDNLKQGESCSVRITTTTNGTPPKFRLGWALPDTKQLSLIPQQAFSYPLIPQPLKPKKEILSVEWMPFADVVAVNPLSSNLHQTITLPPTAINQLQLTALHAKAAQYFSIEIKDKQRDIVLKLDDISLSSHLTWETLSKEIEEIINQQLAPLAQAITISYHNNKMIIKGDGLIFTQFQLKKRQQISYVELLKHVDTQRQHQTVHQIHFTPEQLNHLTHLTFLLTSPNGHHIDIQRVAFKAPTTQFASPNEFADYLQHALHYYSEDNSLQVSWNKANNALVITDPQNRQLEKLSFGYQEQILPFIIAENLTETPNQLTVGAVTGTLPRHPDIQYYQLIEDTNSGKVTLNRYTGEWQYQPNVHTPFSGFEQFDFVAVMRDGSQSAPMSVQLQTDNAPIVSIPGKRTFHIADPIYQEPKPHSHPLPDDMYVHDISLTQTHQQHIDSPYLNLVAGRWALLKIDITSPNSLISPNVEAIVSDKQGYELGRVRLTGPNRLAKQIDPLPAQSSIDHQIADKNSFTAPLKGEWIKPGIQIQLMANNRPIITPYTNQNGYFSPPVHPATHLVARVENSSLYQYGQGLYAYSPLSWGTEAAAKLPVSQFTLYNSPSETRAPALFYYNNPNFTNSVLTMPQYDKNPLLHDFSDMSVAWAYLQGEMIRQANKQNNLLTYMAINPSIHGSILGMASPFFGGGMAQSDILWHEWGHSLGLRHTTDENYPFSPNSNGFEISYDQSQQRYVTYKYTDPYNGSVQEIYPAMYPIAAGENKAEYDAFTPHSSYYNNKIQEILSYTPTTEQLSNDVPVYRVSGSIIPLANGKNHPYSYLSLKRTLGALPANTHNKTSSYSLQITYATAYGLITDTRHIEDQKLISFETPELLSLNIPDKGELVKLQLIETNNQKTVYTYINPDSLANRLFSLWDGKSPLERVVLDHYWQGSQLFWSSNQPHLLDALTEQINTQALTKDSVLCAMWIKGGRLQKQYFSLNDPWGNKPAINAIHAYTPINHLKQIPHQYSTPLAYNVESHVPLFSDSYVNQVIDISIMQLPKEQNSYWLTLLVEEESGTVKEQIPLECWQITRQGEQLSIIGAIDSTPNLKLKGLKIYIDNHLQDSIPASTVTLTQHASAAMVDHRQFIDDNHPILFHPIEQRPELIASMGATENYVTTRSQRNLYTAPHPVSAPLTR